MSAPCATMRLQFHRGFTFDDAVPLVPYLAALGISHLYSSPILTAQPGSMHGYDVVDPTRVNAELGGEPAFRRLIDALRLAGMGIIVDIVPNHMSIGNQNAWWLDVLQHGIASRYAGYFDIDWESADPTLRRKVVLPVLGRPYSEALAHGEITLTFNAEEDRFEARYFDHRFPICPDHRREIEHLTLSAFDTGVASGRQRLHRLLERQHFRLAWWRIANDAINWRRFFDIIDLAALRVEDEGVFEATHAVVLRLFAEGLIDGFRVDHIDGLADPSGYCRRLRSRLEELWRALSRHGHPYLIVEKILGAGEQLPPEWGSDGTTGYDFMDQVSRVLHDPAGEAPLGELWERVSRRPGDFAREEDASRRETLDRSFSGQLDALVSMLHRILRGELATRDIGRPAIRRALIEILAQLRVYRTYGGVRGAECTGGQGPLIRAVNAALGSCLRADRIFVERIAPLLAGEPAAARWRDAQQKAIRRFQQLSAPLAAKAIEDTAFYRYGRLLSRLDVGFEATRFSDDVETFHRVSLDRLRQFPSAMLTTATHDHKRGEDVRARLAVLSSVAGEWCGKLCDWLAQAGPLFASVDGALAPSRADAAILFQTIVGAWPPDLSLEDARGCASFRDRLALWQLKALREAKLATDWAVPNESYEAAARAFLMRLFAGTPKLIGDIAQFANRIMSAGAVNGLAQTLLKLTSPGVPDIYQGTEFWDFSLVDPDNRRAVDFGARQAAITREMPVIELASRWRDGRLKQAVIARALAARRAAPQLFADGDCLPISISGRAAKHVIALARRHENQVALVVVTRLPAALLTDADSLVVPSLAWSDAQLVVPDDFARRSFCDVLSGLHLTASTRIDVSDVLQRLPVALLMATASANA